MIDLHAFLKPRASPGAVVPARRAVVCKNKTCRTNRPGAADRPLAESAVPPRGTALLLQAEPACTSWQVKPAYKSRDSLKKTLRFALHSSRQAEPVRTSRDSSKRTSRFALHSSRVRWLSSRGNNPLYNQYFFFTDFLSKFCWRRACPSCRGGHYLS